ncbi:MAG: DinB family protein [Anaerolineales bacterium]
MEELKEYLAGLFDAFDGQPSAFQARMERFDSDDLHQPLEPNGWSPHQVIAHVLASESEALLPRIQRILDDHEPELPDWDGTGWMANAYSPDRPMADILAEYAAARRSVGARLSDIPMENWNRVGTHPTRGRRTALWWLEYTVAHAKDHLAQLAA